MSRLALALQARTAEVNARVLERELEDPFWLARYGERGRRFIAEDGTHHLRYLGEALVGGSDETFVRYARWLRGVLVSRGMCTHHLVRNFEFLRDLLAELGVPDAERARSTIGAAILALRHGGSAGRLVDAAPRLDAAAEAIARATGAPHPAVRRDLRVLSSFLADAIATGDDSRFLEHVGWRRDACAAAIAGGLDRSLAALGRLAAECRLPAAERLVAMAMTSSGEDPA